MIYVLFILIVLCGFFVGMWYKERKHNQETAEKIRMQTALVKNMVHDMRSPLKSVCSLAEIISNEALYLSKDEKLNISDQMQYSANLIATHLDEIVSFTDGYLRSENRVLSEDFFSPNFLLKRCIDCCEGSKMYKDGIVIRLMKTVPDNFFIKADKHLLELIINKLLVNACKYTEHGEIRLGCNANLYVNSVVFYIEDTGTGIPKERKDYMFTWMENPVYIEENITTEQDLSIVQSLAMRMGGIIRLDDRYVDGTRFLIVLPNKV